MAATNQQRLAEQTFRKYYKKATSKPTRRRKTKKIKVVNYTPQQNVVNRAKTELVKRNIKRKKTKKSPSNPSTVKRKAARRLIWRPKT